MSIDPDQKTVQENYGMDKTSDYEQPVWISTEPYSSRPMFPKLDKNITADVMLESRGLALRTSVWGEG